MGEVSYDTSAQDLIDTYRDHVGATLRRKDWRQAAVFGAVGIGLMLASLDKAPDARGFWTGAGIGLLLALPICWIASWLLLPRRARRLFEQQRTDDRR